jgi:galactose mutarotase-like enzyme
VPTIASDRLQAVIDLYGAQMVSLRHHLAGELLWQGDKAIWADHAPILFPVVGWVRNETLMLDGHLWPMPTHGIAKRSTFQLVAEAPDRVRLSLDGHHAFPFRFWLTLDYTIDGETLTASMTIENHEAFKAMPVNFGFHPGFAWPLPGAADKSAHTITFAESEDMGIRRLTPERLVSAHDQGRRAGRTLPLSEDLFVPSAMMLPGLRSRSVTLSGPTATRITVDFPDFPVLALWMRGGGDYICIEPWHALPQAEDSPPDYADQNGILSIPPGGSHTARMAITVSA